MNKQLHLLFITYYWPPAGGPGVQRPLKFVRYCHLAGAKVTVITVDEKQASYAVTDPSLLNEIPSQVRVVRTPTFEPFEIYRKITGRKQIPHSGFANESKSGFLEKVMRFIRGNFFIPDPRKGWNSHLIKAALSEIKRDNIDVIIVSSPPHSTQLAGLKLKELTGLPLIADLRDPWTDIYYYNQLLHTKLASSIDRKLELKLLSRADAVITVSAALKRLFLSKSGILNEKAFYVIPNGFDHSDMEILPSIRRDKFEIAYTGTMSEDYPIEAFAKAISELVAMNPLIPLHIQFTGSISEKQRVSLLENGLLQFCTFDSYIPHREALNVMSQATVLLLVIPDISNNQGILTGKLFEYIGVKRRILALGPLDGDAAQILRETSAGEMFNYNDKDGIAGFLKREYEAWKQNELFQPLDEKINIYSRRYQAETLLEIAKGLRKG